jgi:hypothetical protein
MNTKQTHKQVSVYIHKPHFPKDRVKRNTAKNTSPPRTAANVRKKEKKSRRGECMILSKEHAAQNAATTIK